MFLDGGMLLTDTNLIENTIGQIGLDRNNYLLAGGHDSTQNTVIIYLLFATCKLHKVSDYDWLIYVLTGMPPSHRARSRYRYPSTRRLRVCAHSY